MKSLKKLCIIVILSVFMISMVVATASAASVPNNEKKDTGIVIDSKSKTVNYKVTWNANGGKIGTKKTVTTTVNKGSKVKLPAAPKRTAHTFTGWFTKSSGGNKITANTKPTKDVTYYAQWKKNPRIVETWKDGSNSFVFTVDGKFKCTQGTGSTSEVTEGNYKVLTTNTIQFSNVVNNPGKPSEIQRTNTVFEYGFIKDSGVESLRIPMVFNDMSYVDISYYYELRRASY